MNSRGQKRSINLVDIEDKYDGLIALEKNAKNISKVSEICQDLNVKKSTVSGWLQHKEKIVKEYKSGGCKKRKIRALKYEEIELALLDWFKDARAKKIPINGPIIMTKASQFATYFKDTEFKPNRESRIYQESVDLWMTKIQSIIDGFEPRNIFNADEGFFIKCFQTKPKRLRVKNVQTERSQKKD
ncbi:unnamed protein product [Brachionus calyciflorus]|uniref:HTH CENPB-type domain-containing protein n=1 Tax=Brachionus calyciflorus TaxID=104777 RepID=A0A814SNQ5_9BILA|nr:unnamed protein product [Brachionus calyciflorus]